MGALAHSKYRTNTWGMPRGQRVLTRFRMDLLMLLPHGARVEIEIDDKHHYARLARATPNWSRRIKSSGWLRCFDSTPKN
jgi:hypothetical protein